MLDHSEGCDRESSQVGDDMKMLEVGEMSATEAIANDPDVSAGGPEPEVDGSGRDGYKAAQHQGQDAPCTPTQAEIDHHALIHLPYRNWCPIYVKGKGKAAAHRSIESHREAGVPVMSIDYAYLCDAEIAEEVAEVDCSRLTQSLESDSNL